MERKRLSPQKKVEILREHLDNKTSISELAEKYHIHPNIISRWKKEMFEGAVETFTQRKTANELTDNKKIEELNNIIKKRDNLIVELATENIDLKKNINGNQ